MSSLLTGLIGLIFVIVVLVVYFMSSTGTGFFAEPKTIQVCDEMGTEQYIKRAPSIGIPLGDSGSPSIVLPVGDDVVRERDVCVSYKTIPNPAYMEKEQ